MAMQTPTQTNVQIQIRHQCQECDGGGEVRRLRPYRDYGAGFLETVENCPICKGTGIEKGWITLEELKELIFMDRF